MVIRTQRMRSASGLAVVCAMGVLGNAVAQAQDRSFHFDIGTQSLSQALRSFAHVCGQEVVFTEDVVAGQATSLKGEYTVQGALERAMTITMGHDGYKKDGACEPGRGQSTSERITGQG